MNLKQINEFRVAHNLAPLQAPAKKKSNGNAAKRAQECRDLKAKRSSNKK
jgi:hypothetical protein